MLLIVAIRHAQWLHCFKMMAAILLGVAVAKERCDSRAVASGAQVSLLCTSGAVLAALWVKATERCSLAEVVTDLRSFCRALCATHKQVMCERGTVE